MKVNERVLALAFVFVIPGRCGAANPESSYVYNFWIPGSREDARPGMIASE
jgi:hypothetical protein